MKLFKLQQKIDWKKIDWLGILTSFLTIFLVGSLLIFLIFIIVGTFPLFKSAESVNFFGKEWSPSENLFGINNFLISTAWTVLLTMIIVIIFTVFNGIFISKFLPKFLKNKVIFMMQFFSGIPSVCFGMFGAYVFVKIFRYMGIDQPQSMLTAILVLSIMILPTTITLTVNLFDNINKRYELSGYALGLNKLTIGFNIIKKICNRKLILILFFGFCRAIGEVTAIALIAGNGPNPPVVDDGIISFLFSSITTLSSLIGLEITEANEPNHEAALFGVSLLILSLVFIVNLIVNFLLNKKIINYIEHSRWHKMKIKINRAFNSSHSFRLINNKLRVIDYYIKSFLMYLIFILTILMFGWVVADITYKGIFGFVKNVQLETGTNDIFYNLSSVLLVTFLLVIATILLSLPMAFFIAIFLVYYGKSNFIAKKIRNIIDIFIYQFSSAPTILFGMFGLTLFVSYLGIGYNMISATLTMILVVLPLMIYTIKQNFEMFSDEQFYSACALGLKKRDIILKLILPTTFVGLLIATILTINKIISESSPVFLTLGTALTFPERGLFSTGRSLATQIFLLQTENAGVHADNIIYQTTLLTLLIIFIFNILVYRFQKSHTQKFNK